MPPDLGKAPSESGQVARVGMGPPLAVGKRAVEVDEQATQGADVLVVVSNDVDERARIAVDEEREIPLRDLPAGDIGVASHPQQGRFHGAEPGVQRPVAEQSPDDGQQIEVARMDRRRPPGEPVAGHDERPVETATVVCHQPAVVGNMPGQLGEQRRLIGMVGQEQLDLPEATALPPSEAHQEGEGACRGREARRFGVEAEQGSVRWRLPRQCCEPLAIERQDRRRCLEPHERPSIGDYELAVQGCRQGLRPDPTRSERRGVDRGGSPKAEAEVRESPLQRHRGGHAATDGAAARSPAGSASAPRSRSASAFAST